MLSGRRTIARTTWLFALAAAVAGLVLLALGQGLTFFADEWAVIEGRSLDLGSFIRPFNEHWLGSTILVYRSLFGLVGLGSYVPYQVVLIALHLLVASEVFVLVRRSAGPVAALAAGVVMLFFGSGFENLYWAMQIGFVGAAALGFGALLAIDGSPSRRRAIVAAVLLTTAVTTSGLGLVMVAAAGLELLLDRERRRLLWVALIPSAIYLAWYLAIGRSGVATARDPFTVEAVAQVPAFLIQGAGSAAGAITGVGPYIGIWLMAGLVGLLAWRIVRGPGVPARTLGCLGGLAVLYLLTGLVRAQLVDDAALYTRYTYLAGPLLMVGLAAFAGPVLAGRSFEPRPRLLLVSGAACLFALALVWNVQLLVAGRAIFVDRAELTRALVTVGLGPSPPEIERDRTLILVPSPASLQRLVAAHGSPLTDPLVIGGVPRISFAALDDALRRALEAKGPLGALPQ